jgi:hypothetical protein
VSTANSPSKPALTWQATIGSSTTPVPRAGGAFHESFAADATRVVQLYGDDGIGEVLNTKTGRPLVSPRPVPLKDDLNAESWTAYDGLVIGAAAQGASALAAYGLGDLKRRWSYPLPAGADVQRVKGCGEHRVCVSSEVNSNGGTVFQVMAVDTQNGKAVWNQPLTAEFGADPGWFVFGRKVVYGENTFTTVGGHDLSASVLDVDKGKATPIDSRANFLAVHAGDGRYQALVEPRLSGSTVHEAVSILDLDTGRRTAALDVGGTANGQPVVSVTGGAVAVLYGGKLYVAQVSAK